MGNISTKELPCGSNSKESACSVGNMVSIPRSGREKGMATQSSILP